jgi:hypothetical protein
MGARVYDPYTGTFLQTDPVQGGGANAYGYTDGDPVNALDLNGTNTWRCDNGLKICHGHLTAAQVKAEVTAQEPTSMQVGAEICAKIKCGGGWDSLFSGFVADHYGAIAETVATVACVGLSGGGCLIALGVGFAAATTQNLSSGHFSGGAELIDALGAIPGAQAAALEWRGVAGASALLPLARLGMTTQATATGIDSVIESHGG